MFPLPSFTSFIGWVGNSEVKTTMNADINRLKYSFMTLHVHATSCTHYFNLCSQHLQVAQQW